MYKAIENINGFPQPYAQIGRWHVIDVPAESYKSTSPYAYVMNNPISHIDVMGLSAAGSIKPYLDGNRGFRHEGMMFYNNMPGSLAGLNSAHYNNPYRNIGGSFEDYWQQVNGEWVYTGYHGKVKGYFQQDENGNIKFLTIDGASTISFEDGTNVSDIITTNADGSRGVNWEGLADYFGDNDFVTIDDDGTTNWGGLVPDWDNAFIRAFTGDIVTAGGGIPIMPGLSLSLNFSWVIHGREASWKPVVSTTVTVSGNSVLSPGAFIGGENLLNGADKITRNLVKTSFTEGDKSFVFGYSFFSGEVTPTNAGYLFGRYLNTGESIFGGISNTWILHDFYKN